MNRRDFLAASALAPLSMRAWGLEPQPSFPGMIIRESVPANLEMPFSSLSSFIVPTEKFFVRSHFAVPKLDGDKYRLRIEGAVDKPQEFTLDDLAKMPQITKPVTLECAGNGRVYLVPKARGVAWAQGAVGTAEWSGVTLATLLERAGVKASATEVILEGADSGPINDDPKSPGPIQYARSVPMEKCRQADGVILATKMNGAELTASHGFPLRAVVSGWYGMAAVKWLARIIVVEKPFRGWWQTFDYTFHIREAGLPVMRAISEMRVKSSIARPVAGEVLKAGTATSVFGAAWSGDAEIRRVEFSSDAGSSWKEAKLLDSPKKHCWQFWETEWTPGKGRHTLMSRATDSRGHTQPMTRDADLRNYCVHHVIPIEVEAR